MDALDLGDWDIFLLAGRYTMLEQTSLDPLLSTCLKRGTSVIAAAPFNGGALMGTGKWNYGKAPPEPSSSASLRSRPSARRTMCRSAPRHCSSPSPIRPSVAC